MDVIRAAGISGEVGVVARLLVDPGARRMGMGTQLLEQARLHLASQGRKPVLDVVASSSAVSLYRRLGWRELGTPTFRVSDQPMSELVFAAPD
jgi:ribosomal protein S18 acetylase RimI-like enzyme